MATQITAILPTLNFPREVDYPTQEDWAAFSAAAEENFGILGSSWSTQMQLWKTQANAMSNEFNTNATIAQGLGNYQGDWTSKGYTLGQSVSVSGVYYICKLTHATGQDPTTGGSIYWNLAIGNWSLKVNNYGNETISGIKTFSYDIVGNITGNAGTATSLLGDETNWASYRSRSVANMLGWKQYGNGHVIFDASSGTSPGETSIDTNNPQISWRSSFPTLMGWNGASTHGVRVDSARVADSTTYATAFTTAVGSAPSYACRAWVNFNGTGTVDIRASGNVSSITDNGVGSYTVNFAIAMPDANYSVATSSRQDTDVNENVYTMRVGRAGYFSTTGVNVVHGYFLNYNFYYDCAYGLVSIFR